MARMVECLPSEHEALSSNSSSTKRAGSVITIVKSPCLQACHTFFLPHNNLKVFGDMSGHIATVADTNDISCC
jgi:hypothetical protein